MFLKGLLTTNPMRDCYSEFVLCNMSEVDEKQAMAAILESKFPLMVAKVNNATIAHLSRDRSREGGL